jgi:hypothetical protein
VDEKDKKEKKDKIAPKIPVSEQPASSTKHHAMEPRLAAALTSMPTMGPVGLKASAQSKPSLAKNPAPDKLKGSMPTMQTSKTPAPKFASRTSLRGVKSNNKEVVSIPFFLLLPYQS